MDYLKNIKAVNWIEIGRDFDYIKATETFKGIKLFPMIKTKALKVAMTQLMAGYDIPVVALVHALDTEARIGDRPNFKEFEAELVLIKEKLNQGEALKKYINDAGINASEKSIKESIFNDAKNLISRILTRLEVMAAELIGTGKITIKENEIDTTIDFNIPQANRITVSNWSNVSHDILKDLVSIKTLSKNKVVRAFTSSKIMSYMLMNTGITNLLTSRNAYPTIEAVKNLVQTIAGVEFVVWDETYKLSALSDDEKRFFPEDTISFVSTKGELGKTIMTTTPAEDYGQVEQSEAYVTVHTDIKKDPVGVWTIASAMGLPVISNPSALFIVQVI